MPDYAALRRAMVDCQVRPADVTRYPIIAAMLAVPREEFVPSQMRPVAYSDSHVPLGDGRVVLDARTFGKLIDAMEIGSDDLVLHVGAGLGYGPAVLGHMAAAVIAVEDDEGRAQSAASNLADADVMNVVVETGALDAGAPAHGPYDAIVVEGAIETLPDDLAMQVKPGGRIGAIFTDATGGQARIGVRTDAGLTWRRAFDATAPLIPGFALEKSFVF